MENMKKIYEFRINVIVNIWTDRDLRESTLLERNNLPVQLQARFDAFLINAGRALTANGFAIVDGHWSDNGDSNSYYYTAIKHLDILNADIRVIIFIRLSDHQLSNDRPRVDARNRYYDSEAQRLKRPVDKNTQYWEFINVVVDGVEQESYRDAVEYMKDEVEGIVHRVYEQEADDSN